MVVFEERGLLFLNLMGYSKLASRKDIRNALFRASEVFPEYRIDTRTLILVYSHPTHTTLSILIHSIHHPVRDPYIIISTLLSPSSSRARTQELSPPSSKARTQILGYCPWLSPLHGFSKLVHHRGRTSWPFPPRRRRTHAAPRARAAPPSSAVPPSTSPIAEGEVGEACTPMHLESSAGRGGLRYRSSPHRQAVAIGDTVFQVF